MSKQIDIERYLQFPVLRPDKIRTFLGLILKKTPEECWFWIGAKQTKGYGYFGYCHESFPVHLSGKQRNGVQQYSHRKFCQPHILAFYLLTGNLPSRYQELDHLCRNKLCCNPWHLEIVASRVNTFRQSNVGTNHILPGEGVYPPGVIPTIQHVWIINKSYWDML